MVRRLISQPPNRLQRLPDKSTLRRITTYRTFFGSKLRGVVRKVCQARSDRFPSIENANVRRIQ